jgi:hypothetical protein
MIGLRSKDLAISDFRFGYPSGAVVGDAGRKLC